MNQGKRWYDLSAERLVHCALGYIFQQYFMREFQLDRSMEDEKKFMGERLFYNVNETNRWYTLIEALLKIRRDSN